MLPIIEIGTGPTRPVVRPHMSDTMVGTALENTLSRNVPCWDEVQPRRPPRSLPALEWLEPRIALNAAPIPASNQPASSSIAAHPSYAEIEVDQSLQNTTPNESLREAPASAALIAATTNPTAASGAPGLTMSTALAASDQDAGAGLLSSVGPAPDSTAAVPAQYASLLARSGLPVPRSLGQLQAMLAGLAIPLGYGHDTMSVEPTSTLMPSLKESAASPHFKLVTASGQVLSRDTDAEMAMHARSLLLSRPTEKTTPDEALATAQNDSPRGTADTLSEIGPVPMQLPLGFPTGTPLDHLVDAPGGAAVAWGGTTATDQESLASADDATLLPTGSDSTGWIGKVMIDRAHPGGPLPPGLQVSARTLAAVAVGLALPNVLILSSGVVRKSRSLRE